MSELNLGKTGLAKTETAVILVAGIGSRLRPLTDDRPKALVAVGGETILNRAVRILMGYGVRRLVLATGYLEEAVRAALVGYDLELVFCKNPRFDSTQNVVSLALCEAAVAGRSFFKLDGDVLFRPELLARLDACDAELAVGVDSSRQLDEEAMKVRAEAPLSSGVQARIFAFGKGITIQESAGESIGIERVSEGLSARLFERLQAAPSDVYYEDIYSQMLEAQELQAKAVEVGDLPWTEIDDHADLEFAESLIAKGAL